MSTNCNTPYCAALRVEAHMPAGRCSNPAVPAQRRGSRWAVSGAVRPCRHKHNRRSPWLPPERCADCHSAGRSTPRHQPQPPYNVVGPDPYDCPLTSHLRTGACTQMLAVGRVCMQWRVQNAVQNTGGNIGHSPLRKHRLATEAQRAEQRGAVGPAELWHLSSGTGVPDEQVHAQASVDRV